MAFEGIKTIFDKDFEPQNFYFGERFGIWDVFRNEIGMLFWNVFKKNYKVMYIKCSVKNFTKLNWLDREFIRMPFQNDYNFRHKFYDETIKIKKAQASDLIKIYNLAFLDKNLSAVFTLPKIKSDKYYYFNIILITTSEFNISDFLNIDFESINIEYFTYLNDEIIYNDFLEKKFHCRDSLCKNANYNFNGFKEVNFEDYNINKKILNDFNLYYKENFSTLKFNEFENLIKLENEGNNSIKLFEKFTIYQNNLINKFLHKNLSIENLCRHIIIFDKNIYNKEIFWVETDLVFYDRNEFWKKDRYNRESKGAIPFEFKDLFIFDKYNMCCVFNNVSLWKK